MDANAAALRPEVDAIKKVKPLARGLSHVIAFIFSLFSGILLVYLARPGTPTLAAGIYALSVSGLFGISALYHRPFWQPHARARLRRIDHAAIYLLIAGTYTPIAMVAMDADVGRRLLLIAWIGAALGLTKSLAWSHAPRWITATLYVLMGWLAIGEWSALSAKLASPGVTLLLAGGFLYTVGAVIYARKRPDPWPATFGYHEVFHILVILAAACHFAMIARIVISFRGPF